MTLYRLCCAALLFSLAGSLAAAQEAGGNGEVTEVENKEEVVVPPPEQVSPPRIKFSCELDGGKKKYSAIQSNQKLGEIFELRVERCTHETSSSGVYSIRLELELSMNQGADVTQCGGFTTAILSRVYVDSADFRWRSNYILLDNIRISNISGDVRSLDYFAIHADEKATKTLGGYLFPRGSRPRFDEHFWANVSLLEENRTGGFQAEVFKRTPVVSQVKSGEYDLTVPIRVQVFEPKGWCIAPSADGKNIPTPLDLEFKLGG